MEFQIHSKTYGTHTVQIDDEDWPLVSQYTWCVSKVNATKIYARTNAKQVDGTYKTIYLHRLLMGLDVPMVDHKNGDGLDCRRNNMRQATAAQNTANRKKARNNTSGFKGVSWYNRISKWVARIDTDGKTRHIGLFDCPIEAAHAYDEAALRLRGEFAFLNFPQEMHTMATAAD